MSDLQVLAEDVADLAAGLKRLTAQLAGQQTVLDELTTHPTSQDDPGDQAVAVPPFILTLTEVAYHRELAALALWVADLLVPVYIREPGPQAPWCPCWWEHPEAVARLHALWLAWQELTTPSAGRSAASVWHREHLDPALMALRAAEGPFAGCMTHPGRPTHRVSVPAPVEVYPRHEPL